MMRLPKIKDVHIPARASVHRILIGGALYGVGAEILDDEEGTVWRLMELMDGTKTAEDVVDELRAERPAIDPASALEAVQTLIELGYVEDGGAAAPAELSEPELERYSRSTAYFAWIDAAPRSSPYEIQRRLKQSRVAVVGLGGSGSSAAMSLVASGVGSVACFDFDLVDSSNLNRQLLYDEGDLGAPKVERAIAHLRRRNSHVAVTGGELRVHSAEDLVPVMESCDLFLPCADRPLDRIQSWTNRAALRTGTPWLLAMHGGPTVIVGLYVPYQTPCFECLMHAHDEAYRRKWGMPQAPRPLRHTPAIAPTAAIAGHLGALEAIYFLAGLRPQTVGRLWRQSLLIYDHQESFQCDVWDDCPACGPKGADPRPGRG
jgi:molybdopterin-synthase adenylyltransferase